MEREGERELREVADGGNDQVEDDGGERSGEGVGNHHTTIRCLAMRVSSSC
jgi:hypothetical protein